jgi:hypothetical protein
MARYKNIYNGERRTIHKSLKLTPSEAIELDTAIVQRGIIWSDFIREAAFRCICIEAPIVPTSANDELVDALLFAGKQHKANGVLMNQIACYKNSTGELGPFTADLREALRTYHQISDMHKAALLRLTAG